jgi:hypothetical protein
MTSHFKVVVLCLWTESSDLSLIPIRCVVGYATFLIMVSLAVVHSSFLSLV